MNPSRRWRPASFADDGTVDGAAEVGALAGGGAWLDAQAPTARAAVMRRMVFLLNMEPGSGTAKILFNVSARKTGLFYSSYSSDPWTQRKDWMSIMSRGSRSLRSSDRT